MVIMCLKWLFHTQYHTDTQTQHVGGGNYTETKPCPPPGSELQVWWSSGFTRPSVLRSLSISTITEWCHVTDFTVALVDWGSLGDAGLLGVCVSAGATGTGEGGWAGGRDIGGDGGPPAGGGGCTVSPGGLGTGSKNEDETSYFNKLTQTCHVCVTDKLVLSKHARVSAAYLVWQSVWRAPPSG